MKYPTIVLYKKDNLVLGNSEKSFESKVAPSVIPFFVGATLIDSELNIYSISDLERINRVENFFSLFFNYFDLPIKVKFKFILIRQSNFDEAKKMIIEHISKNPKSHFMTKVFGSTKKMLTRIERINEFNELVKYLSEDD